MDAKPDPKELQETTQLADLSTCTCKGESKSLIDAAEKGCLKCSATFIRQAKMQDRYGRTALMFSAWNGHLEVTKLLIPLEAKMQRKYDGRTALMLSAMKGHLEIVKLLIPHEIKMKDKDGETALMLSAMKGHLEIAKLLIHHEAGIKTNDGKTATTYAISNYQPSCLRLLLANEKEHEANQIPRIMLAAFDGDIRYLLSNQSEWSTKHIKMTVLDFALLGNQRKIVRLLMSSEEARESFAEEFGSRLDAWNSIALARRFLSTHASFMLDIAQAVYLVSTESKLWLLIAGFIEQIDNASHILRAICTPDAEWMLWSLDEYCNEPQVVLVLAGLKHVGFSNDGKTVESLAKEEGGPVEQYLASNPLKQAQIRRAEKEVWRSLPNEKQACWRETEAESAFNVSLLTRSRDAILSASRPPRRIHDHNSNRIQQKQVLNRRLLMGFVRSMQKIVQEMLDE